MSSQNLSQHLKLDIPVQQRIHIQFAASKHAMNGTPRLRSAWPSTPQLDQKKVVQNSSPASTRAGSSSLPKPKAETTPAIPSNLLDAPSQRLYASLFYLGMTMWRLYNYSTLSSDGTDGFWLFTKWVGIDTAFLYGLSGLNIPWLQWSSSTFTMLFIGHAVTNWMLMFQIPVSPLRAVLRESAKNKGRSPYSPG